jgi:hypothetical protein
MREDQQHVPSLALTLRHPLLLRQHTSARSNTPRSNPPSSPSHAFDPRSSPSHATTLPFVAFHLLPLHLFLIHSDTLSQMCVEASREVCSEPRGVAARRIGASREVCSRSNERQARLRGAREEPGEHEKGVREREQETGEATQRAGEGGAETLEKQSGRGGATRGRRDCGAQGTRRAREARAGTGAGQTTLPSQA